MSVETLDRIDEELARYEQPELVNPALGELVLTAAQIYVNPHAEAYMGEGRMRERDDYEIPEVCRAYNRLSAETQREVTTRMLNGQLPENSGQEYEYQTVQSLLDATLRPANRGRVTLAFEDEWREKAWEVLWEDGDYQKMRSDAQEALDEESKHQATWARNLTALNIVAAISAARYRAPVKAQAA